MMTGAVNLTIDTLAVNDQAARCIVMLYMLCTCGFAVGLDFADITLADITHVKAGIRRLFSIMSV
jgi:hypothetical protein